MRHAIAYSVLCTALLAAAPFLAGKDIQTPSGNDRIDVIAHIPLSGGPVVQLTPSVHWRRNYLYLGHGSESPVTILDVTDPTAPKAVGTLDLPMQEANGNVSTVVGNAVLVASSTSPPAPETVTILNFAERMPDSP